MLGVTKAAWIGYYQSLPDIAYCLYTFKIYEPLGGKNVRMKIMACSMEVQKYSDSSHEKLP